MPSYSVGNKLRNQECHKRHFAWWPVRSTINNKLIWATSYHVIQIFYDESGKPPINKTSWTVLLSNNEYLLYLMRKT